MKHSKKVAAAGLLAAFSLVAAACGSDEKADTTTAAPTTTAGTDTTVPTSDETTTTAGGGEAVCPKNLVIQKDWWPELEHGGTYQLIGPGGTADKAKFTYSGPIQDKYKVGGIETVEIRAGGDAVSFQSVTSLLASDDSITLGYVNLSDLMQDSKDAPAIAVAKTLDRDPQMVMWDPAQNDIQKPEDIKASGKQLLHFDGASYVDYMIGKGYLDASQSNPSYGGAPDTWIAEGGNFFQQGFATNEVYKYENDIAWKDGKPAPVAYYTVGDMGFDNYPAAYSVRADRLEELTPCLKLLVPKLAEAWVDYFKDPTPITDEIIKVNDTYDNYWKVSAELNAAGLKVLKDKGYEANSPDGTYCSLDPDRVQQLADILGPIYKEQGKEVADDLTKVYDNSFCEGAPGN